MTQQQVLLAIFGAYGNFPVDALTPLKKKCHAFEAKEESVISSLKDINGIERIGDIGWKEKSIDPGEIVYFGFEAYEIVLASGSGKAYRTEKPF